jgi:hypothetical protein
VLILEKRQSGIESFAYTSLYDPILEYVAACWAPYKAGDINALGREENKAAKLANCRNDSN